MHCIALHCADTLGCFNYSSWSPSHPRHRPFAPGPVLPSYQPQVTGHLATLEGCAAACYKAKLTTGGMADGKYCFCGTAAELGTPTSKALDRPTQECEAIPCEGKPREKGCGGVGRMLAFAFSCS